MANAKIQPFTSLDQSKHHCYTLSTTCTLFKLASEVGPRTIRSNAHLKDILQCGVVFHTSPNKYCLSISTLLELLRKITNIAEKTFK